jgi:hypothetical protein
VFPRQLIDVFQRALTVRAQGQAGQLSQEQLNQAYERYVNELCVLTERPRANEANDALARFVHNHAGECFVFLLDATVPATNWPANQCDADDEALHPAWSVSKIATARKALQAVSALFGRLSLAPTLEVLST